MYIDPRNPQLQKFQAEKARRKERAIMRKEISTNNPKLTPTQVDQIIDARLALEAMQVERDQKAARFQRPHGNRPPRKQPQIANRAMAIALDNWKK